jgi:hypothetical protein
MNLWYVAALPCDIMRKNVESVFQFAEVCAKYFGVGQNLTGNGSVWSLNWGKQFSSTAFCLEDTPI